MSLFTCIVAAGGFVSDGRVRGALAVSRTLGDVQYKAGAQELVKIDAELYKVSFGNEIIDRTVSER